MKIKYLFGMAAFAMMLAACNNVDNPLESIISSTPASPTTTTITLNLDGNIFYNNKMFFLPGDAATSIAKITEGAPVTITSSDESVIRIDENGNIVPVGPGTATITITVTENEKYTGATETITIVVGRKVAINDETGAEFIAQDGDQITGTAPNTMHLSVPDGALVRLKDATIKPTEGDNTAAIICAGDATIILEGTNDVKGNGNGKAGIQVGPEGKTLIIDGIGSIETLSRSGAAIGSSYNEQCGNITIMNGNITAKAEYGAAIGSGSGYTYGSCQNIIICGGTINAEGERGCAIGSGNHGICQNIEISGGIVNATTSIANGLGQPGAAIGSAQDGTCGDIIITDGTVTAISIMEAGDHYCGAAGIGSGFAKSTCGNILISGGTVDSKCTKNGTGPVGHAQMYGGAGIGTGAGAGVGTTKCGDITITGGNVKATGGLYSAGIGLGKAQLGDLVCGNISITGGIVNAAENFESDAIGKGYGINETRYTIGTVTVDPSVTWNGTKGYQATATGYNKVH